MTKEEILAKYTTKDFIPELGATKTVIEYSKAMQEYADQETERLKAELNEVKKQYSELCDVQKKLCEQNISLDSELNELKERHMNWIKTSEQKPPREPNVRYSNPKMIVWYKGKITMLCFNHEHECWDGEDGDDYCCDIESVEYWMPLPSKPSVG